MRNEIYRPYYVCMVSGGKDSLYMYLELKKRRYPIDMVCYFELEIDYPFINGVIQMIKEDCQKSGILFRSIKPRKTFNELYKKYGYPSRVVRWCNSAYKLDCDKQLKDELKSKGFTLIKYIGICYDETKRYKGYQIGDNNSVVRYPLVDWKVNEGEILKYASELEIYNSYYKFNKRCGCMGCPCTSIDNWTYLYNFYRDEFYRIMKLIHKSELRYNTTYFNIPIRDFIKKIKVRKLVEHIYLI